MSSPSPHPPTGDVPTPPLPGPRTDVLRSFRLVAFALGLLLLGAAIGALLGHGDEISRSWAAARRAPVWLPLAVLLLPLVNWAITSVIFWLLTRRFGAVGLWEMSALMGSAWLLNMLPLKPGLVGRIAYHKAISNIPVGTSLLVTITALITGSIGIALTMGVLLAGDSELRSDVPPGVLLLVGAIVLTLALIPALYLAWRNRKAGRPIFCGGDAAILAIALRIIDTQVWSLRYFYAFMLVGHYQPYGVCIVVASVSQIAGQLPIPLGLREWSVGVSSGVLRPARGMTGAAIAVPGLTADIVCRAAEVCCALPVGIVSTLWVFRQIRRKRAH